MHPTGFHVEYSTRYCTKQTIKIWDVGLRPISPYLIYMANSLEAEDRLALKMKWCEDLMPIVRELVDEELSVAHGPGALTMMVLRKP